MIRLGFTGVIGLALVAALGFVGVYLYVNRKKIADAVNPLSPTNLAYSGASNVVSIATGREESFGGFLAELFSPSVSAVNAMLSTNPAPPTAEIIPFPNQEEISP